MTAQPATWRHQASIVIAGIITVLVIGLAVARPYGPIAMSIILALLVTAGVIAVGVLTIAASAARPQSRGAVPRLPDEPLTLRWERAVAAHDRVLREYADYELDPEMLLRYPRMRDLDLAPIANFHTALDLAGGLRSDEFPGDDDALEYIGAVSMLTTDWATARHAAANSPDEP